LPYFVGVSSASSPTPHSFFAPAKTVELNGFKRCFRNRKELVELR
jgi:hypothetical protein